MTCLPPSSATQEAAFLEREIIPFLEWQLYKARERLNRLNNGKPIQYDPEPDPPKSGASSLRTA